MDLNLFFVTYDTRRVALARAMAIAPFVLLLDEPLSPVELAFDYKEASSTGFCAGSWQIPGGVVKSSCLCLNM